MIDIIIAVILDFLVGDPYWFPHPIIYIGKLISFLEKLCRRFCKSNKTLKISGLAIVIVVCSISFLIPFVLLRAATRFGLIHHILSIVIIWTTVAARSLHREAIKVYKALADNDINKARVKLSYIVGRDTTDLSEKEIIRADVETVAENTSDGVIAPILFAILGGPPLAMFYKAVNTMDSMLGYKNDKFYYIGYFPAKVDDVFNLIPARITGILIAMVSPLVKGNVITSLKIMIRYRKNHKSPNCAYPEGAAAGAMRIQLGGTNSYFGELVYKPTIGENIEKLSKEHIKESIFLMYAAEILLVIFYLVIIEVVKLL